MLHTGAERQLGRDGIVDTAGQAVAVAIILGQRLVQRCAEADRVELAPIVAHGLTVQRQCRGGADAGADDDLRRGVEARLDPLDRAVLRGERTLEPLDEQIALQRVLDPRLVADADGRPVVVHLETGGPAEIPAVAFQLLATVGQCRRQVGQVVAEAGVDMLDVGGTADAQPVGQRDGDRRLDVDRLQLGTGRAVAGPARRVIVGGEAVRRRHGEADRDRAERHGDRARREDAVVDRVFGDRVAADRAEVRRHRARHPGRTADHRTVVDDLALRTNERCVDRGFPVLHAGDRSRVPPQRLRAGVGDFAREGTTCAARRLLLEVKGLGVGDGGETECAEHGGGEKRSLVTQRHDGSS
eukprot:TRINITY_DN3909_c0_g1_i1.p2 TRINITY_DN3909_c0_g1~~TRINITY_DN3909_c0_g1_i1.p2  ORF type:complete len:356 (-),score=-20.49 TRINITY_DN3909_c0_g1_i1:678-1745(-)